MIRSSQRIHRISMCALIGGLGLAASAWAGPLGSGSLGTGGYGGIGVGHGIAASGMAGGTSEFGLGHGVAAGGAAGAYGEFDGRVARDASRRMRSDVNGAVQTQGAAAGQVDAAAGAAASASARPGRVQAGGWAGGQANTQAEVSH